MTAATAVGIDCTACSVSGCGIGASVVVDTRLLGKPVGFDGSEIVQVPVRSSLWSRLKDLLVLGEARDVAAMRCTHTDPDRRALSGQLHFMLIMVCQLLEHAGDTEGGVAWRPLLDEYEPSTARPQELLHCGFLGDPRAALDEFEVLLCQCSARSGEEVSESLKVALVQKGITDDALKTHLVFFFSTRQVETLTVENSKNALERANEQ